jgi:hypothetical protein
MSLKALPEPAVGLVTEPTVFSTSESTPERPSSPERRSFMPRALREGKVTELPDPAVLSLPASLLLPLLFPAELSLPLLFCWMY